MDGTDPVIDSFLVASRREFDYYQEAARLYAQLCEQELRGAGKRVIVMHRARSPERPGGFHETIIPNGPVKPLRIWLEVGDRDLLNPNIMTDNMHDWVVANENMAKVLGAKGYRYQFCLREECGSHRWRGEAADAG